MREIRLDHTGLAQLATEVLSRGGAFSFKASGASMLPFIRHGDVLTVVPVKAIELKVGDVAFCQPCAGRLVAHRVVTIEKCAGRTGLILRGDAYWGRQESIHPEQLIGRVASLQRGRRMTHLDRPMAKITWRLWQLAGPMGPYGIKLLRLLKGIAGAFVCRLQGVRVYRLWARKLLGARVTYRTAVFSDAWALSRLYRYDQLQELENPLEVMQNQMQSLDGRGSTLLAESNGEIVGAVILATDPDDQAAYPGWWLWGMLVRPRYRGAGIGEGLLRVAIERVGQQQGEGLHLLVDANNSPAIRLYSKLGFHPIILPALEPVLRHEAEHGQARRIAMVRRG